MFSILKDKLQSVQDNLTTSFRGLKVADNSSDLTRKHPVDLNAGADLLHKYQTEWQELHQLAEENALAAQKVDVRIGALHGEVMGQWNATSQLTAGLATLPKLAAETDKIISQIGELWSLVVEVESSMIELADTVERKELQERQLESRFQLALHSEKRLAQLDILRAKLSEEHRLKVAEYEKEFEKKQKERQETFSKAFEEDLATYKQTGIVPTIRPPLTSGPSLEEVELEVDTEALNHLLEE
uniref:Dysbindin n=1 Tax=Cuerna arida TaxID=1464854 RepID=A0A1B6FG93_9HEMI